MAGRKTPPKQDLLSTLLGKFGIGQPQKPQPKKKRKGPPRPKPAEAFAPEGLEPSPFAEYAQEPGLGFNDGMTYEDAAAAGFAPPPVAAPEPLFPDAEPALPSFGAPVSAPGPRTPQPAFVSAIPAPDPGKLFNEAALDNSLDALFAGLEMGTAPGAGPELPMAPPPPPPISRQPITSGSAGNIVAFPGSGSAAVAEMPAEVAQAPAQPPAARSASFTVDAPAPLTPVTSPPAPYAGEGPTAPTAIATLSQGTDLRALLATIDRTPGVTGSLLVGYDGLIIAFTLPPTVDRDFLAAQACNMFTGSNQHMQQIGRGELRRMILETATGAMLMTAADMGILVVVSDGLAMDPRSVSAAISGALGQV